LSKKSKAKSKIKKKASRAEAQPTAPNSKKRLKSTRSKRKAARYSRVPALVIAGGLLAFCIPVLLAFANAPSMVIETHSGRMRLYLGAVATACGVLAVGLVAGGSGVDRAIQGFIDRLRDDLAASLKRGKAALKSTPNSMLVALVLLMVVGTWIRLRYIGEPMRYDEAYTYNFYGRFPLAISLSAYESPNNHIFNTLLLHISTSVFGNSEWSVRLPALVFGVASIPAVYLVSRLFAGIGSSLVAAAATAGWPVLVEYSVNARGYSAVAFFFVVSLLAAKLLLEDDRLLYRAVLVLATIAILYTTPAGIYAVATCWGWLAISAILRKGEGDLRLAGVVGMGVVVAAATAVLYAFPLIVGGFGTVLQRSDIRPMGIGAYLSAAPHSISDIGRFVFRSIPLWGTAVVAATAVVGVAKASIARSDTARIVRIPVVGLAPALAVTVLQRQWPYTRAWIFVAPLVLVASAEGLDALGAAISGRFIEPSEQTIALATSFASIALGGSLVASLAVSGAVAKSTDTGYAPDAKAATLFLKERLEPDDSVLVKVPADAPLIYYFMREGMGVEYMKPRWAKRAIAYVNDESQSPESVYESFGIRPAGDARPEKIWQGESASLYELTNFTSG
jgi:hypothetical protein